MGKYRLRYLPIALQDLCEIADYITNNLQNPAAAENTLAKIESAIWYVVIDSVMEVRRILYSRRNEEGLI